MIDSDLDSELFEIIDANRNLGEIMLWGALKAKNINVTREALRDSMKRIDLDGVESRKRKTVKRRVPHPNYLWHLDGNHKLIKYLLSSIYFLLLRHKCFY